MEQHLLEALAERVLLQLSLDRLSHTVAEAEVPALEVLLALAAQAVVARDRTVLLRLLAPRIRVVEVVALTPTTLPAQVVPASSSCACVVQPHRT